MGEVTVEELEDRLRTLLQICTVTSVDAEKNEIHMKASVTKKDDDGNTTHEQVAAICKVLTWGVKEIKYVHTFEVDDKVLCYFPSKEGDPLRGYAIGTFFGDYGLRKPPEKVRGDGIYFASQDEETGLSVDNGYLKYSGDGEIIAKVANDIVLKGRAIQLN